MFTAIVIIAICAAIFLTAGRFITTNQQNQRDADALNAYLESRLRHPSSRYYLENHHDD